jgi:hypothetical protein
MLALSDKWAPVLRRMPEAGMGYTVASIYLSDGRRFDRVMIVGGYITNIGQSEDIPFGEEDIVKIEADYEGIRERHH